MGPNLPNQTPEQLSEQSEAGGVRRGGSNPRLHESWTGSSGGREGCCVSWHKTQSFHSRLGAVRWWPRPSSANRNREDGQPPQVSEATPSPTAQEDGH